MLNVDTVGLVVIDVQEKLVKAAFNGEQVANNVSKLVKASNILGLEILVTEQYPKGLGSTVSIVSNDFENKTFLTEKTSFSALAEDKVKDKILEWKEKGIKQIIICGIETHICVLQTALSFINEGFEVFVVCDASASRTNESHVLGLDFMKQSGVYVVNLEIILFDLLKTSKNTCFKEVQALIK